MLVADDSRTIRRILHDAAAMTQLPLRVTSTDNGRDCLTLLQSREVDLAFIDVNMPDLSGTEAFWTARKLGVETFVTLMSAPPSPQAVDMARKLKAYEFLFKPFEASNAAAIIKTYARISAPTKVLIVDDSQTVRQIVQKTIAAGIFKCEIAQAADGQTAIRRCNDEQFDVVFLDCNMPGLSGLDTLQQIVPLNPALKVVMISAERDAARDLRARRHGAFAFLPKPFTAEDMDAILHDIHGLRSPNLQVRHAEPDFDVDIEGSTIRLVHNASGDVFEYLWFKDAPYLRNATINAAPADEAKAACLAAVAERAALERLNSARLVAA
jgi:DNA-binding NtrC family response regulator